MKKTSCILLVFAAAMMLFGFGCASADIADGLVYDETDNTWAAGDEDLTELAGIMKHECAKSPIIKGTYICSLQAIRNQNGFSYELWRVLLYLFQGQCH